MYGNLLANMPPATKYLLIITITVFILVQTMPDLNQILALHYRQSPLFMPHQLVSHIFMHGGLSHLIFNMYALAMFGSMIENQLGTKRFLFLYFFAAIGAFLLHMGITRFQLSDLPANILTTLQTQGASAISNGKNFSDPTLGALNAQFNGAMVGASGAIMGLLMVFAMRFPDVKLGLFFVPVMLPAKFFMPIYMVIELVLGVSNFQRDNIAHFAHLGGALFGAILMLYWRNSKNKTRLGA